MLIVGKVQFFKDKIKIDPGFLQTPEAYTV